MQTVGRRVRFRLRLFLRRPIGQYSRQEERTMFDPQEPPEPSEDEMRVHDEESSAKQNDAIQISGLTVENVRHIMQGVLEQEKYNLKGIIAKQMKEEISAAVQKLVAGAMEDDIRAWIKAEVENEIQDGIKTFDSYTGKVKEVVPLGQYILALINSKETRGDYQKREEGTFIGFLVKDTVKAQFQASFGKELEAAQKELRSQVDDMVKAKLAETLKSALGLR